MSADLVQNQTTTDWLREGYGLLCLTSLSTIIQLYRGGQFYLGTYIFKNLDGQKLLIGINKQMYI